MAAGGRELGGTRPTAYDADVLIYAAVPGHALGSRVAQVLDKAGVHIGSVLLVPELLSKPLREGRHDEVLTLTHILSRLALAPTDRRAAALAATLAGRYHLRAADAVHLSTAVLAGATRFLTNNRRDFPTSITEIDVVYPADL